MMLVRIGNQICRWDLTKGQMTVFGSEEVQKPGSRGGKWWLDDRGHVRYDERPKGKPKKQEVEKPKYPSIVQRAIDETVTDIGQLSKEDKKLLDQHVKSGILDKGKGGPYPIPKLVYAKKGFKFQEERDREVKKLLAETNPKYAKKKEIWQMTRGEYLNLKQIEYNKLVKIPGLPRASKARADFNKNPNVRFGYEESHRKAVEQALDSGKDVPADVLKDYPDLQKKESKPASEKKTTIWQKAKQEAQQRIDEIADQWRLKGAPDDIDAMREAIKEVAKKYGIPYDVLRKQTLWEVQPKSSSKRKINIALEQPKEQSKQSMSFHDKAKRQAWKGVKLPDFFQPLIDEAKKFKTAKEFIEALNPKRGINHPDYPKYQELESERLELWDKAKQEAGFDDFNNHDSNDEKLKRAREITDKNPQYIAIKKKQDKLRDKVNEMVKSNLFKSSQNLKSVGSQHKKKLRKQVENEPDAKKKIKLIKQQAIAEMKSGNRAA